MSRPEAGATLNLSYVVPKDKAEEVKACFEKHAAWMKTFYADSTEHLIACYFNMAPLFKVPTDPSQGETDSMVFCINEEFAGPESVGRHIENASKNDYFPEFAGIMDTYAKVVSPMGQIYFKIDFAGRCEGDPPPTGATLNLSYVVPKDKAEEVKAVFEKHAAWMKTFYADSTEHLICCYFTMAPLFNVPTDPSQGESDNMTFFILEQFTSPESIGRHIENAMKNDYFPEFGGIMDTYAKTVSPMGQVYFSIRK
jgi:quinol monooxygenase YgiN/uncharacterized protein YciI